MLYSKEGFQNGSNQCTRLGGLRESLSIKVPESNYSRAEGAHGPMAQKHDTWMRRPQDANCVTKCLQTHRGKDPALSRNGRESAPMCRHYVGCINVSVCVCVCVCMCERVSE